MTIRTRLRTVERRLRMSDVRTLVLMWPCHDLPAMKARVARARGRGWRVRVIRFGLVDSASDLEGARAMADQCPDAPVTVEDADTGKVLVDREPPLPRWLVSAMRPTR